MVNLAVWGLVVGVFRLLLYTCFVSASAVDGVWVGREHRSILFYTTETSLPLFLLYAVLKLLTVICHGCPSVIKLICLLPAFMQLSNNVVVCMLSWMIRPSCEITDQHTKPLFDCVLTFTPINQYSFNNQMTKCIGIHIIKRIWDTRSV